MEPPSERRVEERARKIVDGQEDEGKIAEGEKATAKRAADAILEESEERTFDNATVDIEDDTVSRRKSDETARNPNP